MKSITSKTLPYRKCETVHNRLIEGDYEELSKYDLRRLISEHCAASPNMIDVYERRFVDFGFLKNNPKKLNSYLVCQKDFFSTINTEESYFSYSNFVKKNLNQSISKTKEAEKLLPEIDSKEINQQSKTLVYLKGGSHRKNYTIKVNESLKIKYVKRVKELGLDCCYVQEAWMNAFMAATNEAKDIIHVPVQIGLSVLNVNLILPYVVSKPRRHRKKVKTIEEEEIF